MKKSISVTACIIMIFMMAIVLSGCGKQTLEGTWTAKIDFGENLSEEIGEDADIGEVPFSFSITFNKDGTYSASFDEESIRKSLETAMPKIVEAYKHELAEEFEIDDDDDLDGVLEFFGISTDEIMDEYLSNREIKEFILDSFSEGQYRAENGKLYISNSVYKQPDSKNFIEYELGKKLIITKSSDDYFFSIYSEDILPLELTK